MNQHNKIFSYLGLAARGRLLTSGEFGAEQAVKSGKANLVIIATDASENTKKKFRNMCTYYHVDMCVYSSKEELGHAIGKEFRASIAITDSNLAGAVQKCFSECLEASSLGYSIEEGHSSPESQTAKE